MTAQDGRAPPKPAFVRVARPKPPATAPAPARAAPAPPPARPLPALPAAAAPSRPPARVPPASREPLFQVDEYHLEQKILSLGRKYYLLAPDRTILGFAQGTIIRLRGEIRVYDSEDKVRELLVIRQNQILDSLGKFEVRDPVADVRVGSLGRKYWRSWLRDEWRLYDAAGAEVGRVKESSWFRAILTRLPYVGLFVPKHMTIFGPGEQEPAPELVQLHRRLWSFGKWRIDLTPDRQRVLDRRLVLATLLLMEGVEQYHDVQG